MYDNITTSTFSYNDVSRFQSNPDSARIHPDGVERTESYLIQNMTTSQYAIDHSTGVGSVGNTEHLIRVYPTTKVAADLNKYWRNTYNDYYLYTIHFRAYLLPEELSGAAHPYDD